MAAPNRPMEHSFRLRSQPGRLGRIRGRATTLGHPGFVTGQCRHIQPVCRSGTNDVLHLSGHFHYLFIAEIGIMVKAIQKGPES